MVPIFYNVIICYMFNEWWLYTWQYCVSMSSQKGNVNRTRPQKHTNIHAFKNSMHDTTRLTQMLNSLEIHGVCARCKDQIEWRIKYKKYKPLASPKKWYVTHFYVT